MSKTYVAVQRTGADKNELQHWKYIKREKRPNGKWRYYYDDPYADNRKTTRTETTQYKYGDKLSSDEKTMTTFGAHNTIKERGLIDKTLGNLGLKKESNLKYEMGTTEKYEVERVYKDSDDWFNSTRTATLFNAKVKTITHERGKAGQLAAKAEKWIYDKFLKD